jgi:hypothetical protein
MNETKTAFLNYFSRLNEQWRRQCNSLPKTPLEEEAEDDLLVGPPDDDGLVEWQAKEIQGEPPQQIAEMVSDAVLH